MKLIEKRRWQIAVTFVGSDAALQQTLLEHMVAAGELQHARVVAQRLGLTDFDPSAAAGNGVSVGGVGGPNGAPRAASTATNGFSQSVHAAALRGFLELRLSEDAVVFCDSEADVRVAMAHFFGIEDEDNEGTVGVSVDDTKSVNDFESTTDTIATSSISGDSVDVDLNSCSKSDERIIGKPKNRDDGLDGAGSEGANPPCSEFRGVVGLDVEWKPTTSKIAAATGSITTTAVASILQIASASKVFLIDLLALHVRFVWVACVAVVAGVVVRVLVSGLLLLVSVVRLTCSC